MHLPELHRLLDIILTKRWKSGDPKALAYVLAHYRDKIYNRSLSILHNKEDAQEVTEDTFIQANKHVLEFREKSMLLTWLYRIATYLSFNKSRYLRRRGNFLNTPLDFNTHSESSHISPLQKLSGSDITPDQKAIQNDLLEKLLKDLQSLNPDHQKVITLHFLQNKTYDEISQYLNCPIGTIKSRIARACKELQFIFYKKL